MAGGTPFQSVFSQPTQFSSSSKRRRSRAGFDSNFLRSLEASERRQEELNLLQGFDAQAQAEQLGQQISGGNVLQQAGVQQDGPEVNPAGIFFGGLQVPLDIVKNLGEAGFEAINGDGGDALRALGRAGVGAANLATPFIPLETILEQAGVGEGLAEALAPQTGAGTGTSINRIGGSSIRGRDVGAEVGALFGEERTNTDPNGALGSEFGKSRLQDFVTGAFEGLEIVGDPVNFIVPGAGAVNKGLTAGSKLASAAKGVAATKALKELDLLKPLSKAGFDTARLTPSNIAQALRVGLKMPEEDAMRLRGSFSDIFRPTEQKLLEGSGESADLFRRFGSQGIRDTLNDALKAQSKTGAQGFIPRESFAAQAAARQRTLFSGPYGAVLGAALGGKESTIVRALDDNYFGFMTGLNEAVGGGSTFFKPAQKTMQLMKAKVAAGLKRGEVERISVKDAETLKKAFAGGVTTLDPDTVGRKIGDMLGKIPGKVFKPIISDAKTPEALHQKLMMEAERTGGAYVFTTASNTLRQTMGQIIDSAKSELPTHQIELDDFYQRVISEIENKAGAIPGRPRGLTGRPVIDQLITAGAKTQTELNQMLLDFQRVGGVGIEELVDDIGWWGRYVKPEYQDIMHEEYFKSAVREVAESKSLVPQGTATKARGSGRGLTFAELNERVATQLSKDGRLGIDAKTTIFQDDLQRGFTDQAMAAIDRSTQSRLMTGLFDEFAEPFDAALVGDLVKTVKARKPNFGDLGLEQKIGAVRDAVLEARVAGKLAPDEGLGLVDGLSALQKHGTAAVPRDIESLVQMSMQKLPKDVLDDFENVFALTRQGEQGPIMKAVDSFTGFFRTALLSAPTSLLNDIMGTITMGGVLGGQARHPIQSFTASRAYAAAMVRRGSKNKALKLLSTGYKDKTFKSLEGGEKSILQEVDTLIDAGFFEGGTTIASEAGKAGGRGGALNKLTLGGSSLVRKGADKIIGGRAGGENLAKAGQYILHRSQGMSAQDAISQTRKIFYDYKDITKFERDKLRKAVLFYTWAKKSIPVALRSSLETPIKFKLLTALVGAKANNDPDAEEWLKRIPGDRIGTDKVGNPTMLSLGNTVMTPMLDIMEGNVMHNLLRSATPPARLVIEMAMETDLFTGKPISFGGSKAREEAAGLTANRAPSSLRFLPGADKIFGFAEKHDKDGNLIGYTMDSDKRFMLENVLALGGLLRTADVVTFGDPRKTIGQQLGSAVGVKTISIKSLREDQKLLSQIRKAEQQIIKTLDDLPGKPLRYAYGRVLPNATKSGGTGLGVQLKKELDEAKKAASDEARKRGYSREHRGRLLEDIERRYMGQYYPQLGTLKELLERMSDTRDYLDDPEAFETKREARIKSLLEADSRARLRFATGLR